MVALRIFICAALHATAVEAGLVYLIRHGEKKSTLGDLSDVGKARANYIAQIFTNGTFQQPESLYAAKYSLEPERTLHTIQPLGDKLGITIDNDIHTVMHRRAAKAITGDLSDGKKVVLACWEHLNIGGVCKDLGIDKDVCGDWDGDDYDSVYEITFPDAHSDPTLKKTHEGFRKLSLDGTIIV